MSKKNILLFLFLLFGFMPIVQGATYLVDNLADTDNGLGYTGADGTNTLRKCIRLANASAGADIINFNVAGVGPHTITLTSALPALSDNSGVTIDGFTQSGASANTISVFNSTASTPMNAVHKIILTGSLGGATYLVGFTISSNNNVIKGLVLKNFNGTATSNYYNNSCVYITGNSNSILGCYIGVSNDGITIGGSKTGIGIYINGSAVSSGQNNIIGDGTAAGANLISGFKTHECIRIYGANATGNRVRGNMLGLQKNGTSIVSGSTQDQGVFIFNSAYSNTIGGTNSGEGNVISGNSGGGVFLNSNSSSGNSVLGNIIGSCADGLNAVSSNPQLRGIYIIDSPNNTIGGGSAGARNVISGNEQYGVFYQGATTSGNNLKGNYIGINKNGTDLLVGNSQDYGIGTIATGVGSNTIGGSGANEGNLISGNTSIGVWISSGAFTFYGNIIGSCHLQIL